MPVLIDGNNLLFAAIDSDPDRPIGRSKLCQVLGEWARRRVEQVEIVFDGPAPPAGLASQIGDPDVSVRFSGKGVKADAVIIDIINQHSAPRRLLVVSSDREIAHAARRRKAVPVRADEFWTRVQEGVARDERRRAPLRPKRDPAPDLRQVDWLREFGFSKEPDPDDSDSQDSGSTGRG